MPNKTDDPQPEQPKEPQKLPKFMYNYTPYELSRLARGGNPVEKDRLSRRLEERMRKKKRSHILPRIK